MKDVLKILTMFVAANAAVACGDDLSAIRPMIPDEYTDLIKWADGDTKVYLFVQSGLVGSPYKIRLIVDSPEDLKVYYRTCINSSKHVERELPPADQIEGKVRCYDFQQSFTRTSIWMALDFKKDGEVVAPLTRTFFGDMKKIVPN